MEQRKKRLGDRYDAWKLRGLDPMHAFIPYLLPRRTDNEAILNELLDLTAVEKYLEKKNADKPAFKYTIFHVLCAAMAKTIYLRPRMNYFISGRYMYERKDILLAFVVKQRFADDSREALAIVKIDKDSGVPPITQIHDKVERFVTHVRKEDSTDGATDVMSILTKLPRFILQPIVWLLFFLDFFGILPKSLVEEDPYHTTAFLSNLGSIKMSANYHHLTNWGTNSIFAIIGEKSMRPFYQPDGSFEMRQSLELGLTIDERIADGVYFAKSIRLLRQILAEPEILDLPIDVPVEKEEN